MNAEQLIERVARIYERTLGEDAEARAFLEGKGLGDARLHEKHRIGYSNGTLGKLLPKSGPVLENLTKLGVLLDSPSTGSGQAEYFLNCLIFPIADIEGRILNLAGHDIKTGEYRFLPQLPITAWNIAVIRTFGEAWLAPSILEALRAQATGRENVMWAANGQLAESDMQLVEKQGVKLLIPQSGGPAAPAEGESTPPVSEPAAESAGVQEGTEEPSGAPAPTTPIPEAGRQMSLKTFPWGFVVEYGRRKYEVRGVDKRAKTLRLTIRVENAGKLFIDTTDLYSSRFRKSLVVELSRFLEEKPDILEADMTRLIRLAEEFDPAKVQEEVAPMPDDEKTEAESFGQSADLIERIQADYETCGLIGESANKLMCYLAMTSRKMDDPLCILILSSSGAGKTALQDVTLSLCPPEELVKVTSLSGKALFYRDPSSLKHKALAIEEEAGAEDADYALRSLITSKQLSIEAVVKDLSTGRLVTMRNVVQGRTAVFLTTTNPYVNPETRSRFVVLSVDESREQTRAILEHQRRRQTAAGFERDLAVDEVQRRHRNFQRLLRPLKVVNPYAEQLGYGDDRLQGRRDQPKYLNLIKAAAFLRQMSKPVKRQKGRQREAGEYIEVDRDDIRFANNLAHEILGHSLDELSRPSRELLRILEQLKAKKEIDTHFTRREIREKTGWSNYRTHTHLKELVDFEYLASDVGREGIRRQYRLMYEGQGGNGSKFMLGLRDVEDL